MKVFSVNPVTGEIDEITVDTSVDKLRVSQKKEYISKFENCVPTSSLPFETQIKLRRGESIDFKELSSAFSN